MESGGKFVTFILVSLILLIIACVTILGVNIFQDFFDTNEVVAEVQNKISNIENKVQLENLITTPKVVENPINKINTSNKSKEQEQISYSSQDAESTFFCDQLDSNARIIYDGLTSNKENLKTGTYSIAYGTAFSSLLSKSDGQKKLGDAYQSAIEAFSYDNPDVFYLNPNKMYLNIQTETRGSNVTYKVFINNGKEKNYLADGFTSKEQIDSAETRLKQLRSQISNSVSGSNYQKAKQIQNYLVDHITYDTTISKKNIYDIYGALINGESVCEGYAKSYKYLLDAIGIPCVIIVGQGTNSQGETENHSWNYIQIDGNWYAVDVTWNDPIISGGGTLSDRSRYKYFLRGKNTIDQDHIPNGQFTSNGKIFEYPNLSDYDYE